MLPTIAHSKCAIVAALGAVVRFDRNIQRECAFESRLVRRSTRDGVVGPMRIAVGVDIERGYS